ncbi:F0F1 ATP synthase subunit gamma [Sphingomicrobium marinum]|uniref:F0F1 ATP synthase subunit gamma n=1 Tax=Sphingomicrobium marinum TaxID=1227950 RepID=UPI0022403417|nr:F0F1 ATP synthase subunit gamma [Sphingomicrobium marinum]
MASLKELKGRINSVKSTQKITKAMKMVAAAKLKRATERAEAGRPYATRLADVVSSLAARITVGPQSPKLIAGTGSDKTHLIIVCTADKGLAGAFNTNIVKAAKAKAETLQAEGKEVFFYVVGRKSKAILNRFFPGKIIGEYVTMEVKNPGYEHAQAVADDIIDRYESGRFDVAHLAYAEFENTLVQRPQIDQLIPVKPAEVETGKGASAAVEYEPDEEAILADLLPKNVAIQIFRAMLENQAGFYGSQMTAMDNATRNAGDMINRLEIRYNRERQAAITTELVEIISGAEAL